MQVHTAIKYNFTFIELKKKMNHIDIKLVKINRYNFSKKKTLQLTFSGMLGNLNCIGD